MIDRSKFKKTSVTQLVQADKELNKVLGKKERNNSNGHDLDDGANLLRIYPVHPDIAEKDPSASFAVPFVQTFIPAMVHEKTKDGTPLFEDAAKKVPKLKEGQKPVWNAKVHGNKPKDLIEEYINLCLFRANEMNLDKEGRNEYLMPIYGQYLSKGNKDNVNGINYGSMWVMYADKYPAANSAAIPVFDEWRIKKGIKERLNKISAVEAAGDPLGTDPFTDIEEGKAIKVFKDTEASNPQNYYTTELDNSTVSELIGTRTVKIQKTYPLTDDQLKYFLDQEPLHTKYGIKLATRKNFDAQLAGLAMLDTKWQMGIFEMPEWEAIVKEIDSYYPAVDPPQTKAANSTTPATTEENTVVDPNADEYDLMDRAELTAFCKEYKTGIFVRPAMKDDDIRNKIRQWVIAQDAGGEVEQQPEVTPDPVVETVAEVKKEAVAAPANTATVVLSAEQKAERQEFIDDLTGVTKTNAGKSQLDKLKALREKNKQQAAA